MSLDIRALNVPPPLVPSEHSQLLQGLRFYTSPKFQDPSSYEYLRQLLVALGGQIVPGDANTDPGAICIIPRYDSTTSAPLEYHPGETIPDLLPNQQVTTESWPEKCLYQGMLLDLGEGWPSKCLPDASRRLSKNKQRENVKSGDNNRFHVMRQWMTQYQWGSLEGFYAFCDNQPMQFDKPRDSKSFFRTYRTLFERHLPPTYMSSRPGRRAPHPFGGIRTGVPQRYLPHMSTSLSMDLTEEHLEARPSAPLESDTGDACLMVNQVKSLIESAMQTRPTAEKVPQLELNETLLEHLIAGLSKYIPLNLGRQASTDHEYDETRRHACTSVLKNGHGIWGGYYVMDFQGRHAVAFGVYRGHGYPAMENIVIKDLRAAFEPRLKGEELHAESERSDSVYETMAFMSDVLETEGGLRDCVAARKRNREQDDNVKTSKSLLKYILAAS